MSIVDDYGTESYQLRDTINQVPVGRVSICTGLRIRDTGSIYLRVDDNSYLEELAYEGTLVPEETDIGVLEDGNGLNTFSLQRRFGCAVCCLGHA